MASFTNNWIKLMAFEIKKDVFFTGKIDWESKNFHGESMTTQQGTSYNSYLILDKKTVIIDSVPKCYTQDYLNKIREIVDISKIEAYISLHGEPDHSGALSHLLSYLPDLPVYCTAAGEKILRGHYHKDWNFNVVKTGDKLDLGSRKLRFIETPMLHWPDTMTAFLEDDNMLFSSDIFGQHFASEFMFDDKVDYNLLMWETMKYYANIIAPFSSKVKKTISIIQDMGLPLDILCPAHGVFWRRNVESTMDTYEKWADSYSENQITIIYDTMYDSTRKMAEAIAEGITSFDAEVRVKLFNSSKQSLSDITTEIFRSKGLIIGSPTYNYGVLHSTAALLEEIDGMKLSGKKAGAFGSYGWSPASTKIISEQLEKSGFEIIGKGLKINWAPDTDALNLCRKFGEEFSSAFK